MSLFFLSILAKVAGAWTAILGWLANPKNWPLVIIACLVLTNWAQCSASARKDKAIVGLQGEIATYRTAVKSLESAISDQNAAIDDWKHVGDLRTGAAQKAVQAAHKGVVTARAASAHVLAYQPPAGRSEASVAVDILKGRADR